MPKSTRLPGPVYAAAGATDLAVEKLREIPAEYRRLQERAKRVDASTVRVAVEDYSSQASTKAMEAYSDLVSRGQKLVNSIRRQKATEVLVEQATVARRQAKATVTTARKGATQTRTRAKATTTSARKTAAAAVDAAESAAAKVG